MLRERRVIGAGGGTALWESGRNSFQPPDIRRVRTTHVSRQRRSTRPPERARPAAEPECRSVLSKSAKTQHFLAGIAAFFDACRARWPLARDLRIQKPLPGRRGSSHDRHDASATRYLPSNHTVEATSSGARRYDGVVAVAHCRIESDCGNFRALVRPVRADLVGASGRRTPIGIVRFARSGQARSRGLGVEPANYTRRRSRGAAFSTAMAQPSGETLA